MPFRHGSKTELWLDAVDVSTYFNSLGFAIDIDIAESSTFKAAAKTFEEGLAGAKVTAKGYYDKVNDAQLATILRNGGSVLTYGPGGMAAIGDLARLISIHETNLTESSPVGGLVLMSFTALGEGITGFGWALHPLAIDSGTTTGATRDDAAASSTGWTAHLHVIAVSSGSWVVKLQDASAANFSDGADVTDATFTAATGPTQQRLRGAALTTTVRRYVRYVATVTGGSTPTITFGLAYSRN